MKASIAHLNDMLNKWTKVNSTTTLDELANVIESFSDEEGTIQGRAYKFNGKQMASNCRSITLESRTSLTRMYGIRQQAIYLLMKTK